MVTSGQRAVINVISHGPRTASDIAYSLELGLNTWTYDRVHSILRRLEDRELVRRLDRDIPASWELTAKGRKEFAKM